MAVTPQPRALALPLTLQRWDSPMLSLWSIEVVSRGVQPGEDGRGDVERQLLMEEALLLGSEHEHFVIH